MTSQQVREMSPEEIRKELRDTREKLLDLRVRKRIGQVENPVEVRNLRRDVARMNTILQEKSQPKPVETAEAGA